MGDTDRQTLGFQTEVKQLLHLMVHSLYSNKEIFLRELVSNASDANDRLRFEALAKPELLEDSPELVIHVSLDPQERLLCITDNGIGMSREEITEQLGTIAHSGTTRFLEQLSGDQQKDSQLIGQFGVGFYSAFIVAEQVEVLSRKAGLPEDQGVRWTSDGHGEFTVESLAREERGTSVRLKLKADEDEFLDPHRVRALIRKYSDHIAFPVRMLGEGEDRAEETVNRAKALWSRPRTEIEDEEYVEFYRHIAHEYSEPLAWTHNKVEGKREYTSLLYIPSVAPLDLWNREGPRGVKLYVQRVFITDDATQFLPLYLRFTRGVVDSNDLSLNVSRELLQQDPNVRAINNALIKRVLDLLERLSREQPEKYRTFWREFGAVLKEGIAEDHANREKISGLLRFNTTRSEGLEQDRSLDDYIGGAAEGGGVIYYLTADSPASVRTSPHLEVFAEKDVEVLLLSDRIDEWVMQHLPEYKGKTFRDIARGELDLDSGAEAPSIESEPTKEHKHLLKRVKRALRERVKEVRMSTRLKESAACLVLGDEDLGHQMRELLKATGAEAPESAPTLELNPDHPLIRRLESEPEDERFDNLALVLLEQATLAEGRQLNEPAAFVRRVNELLVGAQTSTQDGD